MTRRVDSEVHGLVEHLFRRSAGQMLATLTNRLGSEHLELAEEVVQEAMLTALQVWAIRGIPENPRGWLFRVATNRAIDRLRRQGNLARKLESPPPDLPSAASTDEDDAVTDDELRMIFMCCHPSLGPETRVALTLKIVGGFGVEEIARAFLSKRGTVQQRLVRAKRVFKTQKVDIAMPDDAELVERLESVCEVLYLMFNEGYAAHDGADLVREDLCQEAIRLGELLARRPVTNRPELQALLALMYFQSSRLGTRIDCGGSLVTLEDQDRLQWNRDAIVRGMRCLQAAGTGHHMGRYHIEAGIAAIHSTAPTSSQTDWRRILEFYDRLLELTGSPVVALNRAVAVAKLEGPRAGMMAVEKIRLHPAMTQYYLVPATLGDMHRQLGDPARALDCFRAAQALPASAPERRFLQQRIHQCEAALSGQVSGAPLG